MKKLMIIVLNVIQKWFTKQVVRPASRAGTANVDKYPPLKKIYYLGKIAHGNPYFYPINFSDTIIKIRKLFKTSQEDLDKLPNQYQKENKRFKNMPMVRRSKDWIIKIFNSYYWLQLGWPITIVNYPLGWKDKFDSPRFEWSPSFQIYFFKWQFCIHWIAPNRDDDNYWEQWLWIYRYNKGDYNLAKEKWPWYSDFDTENQKSSWIDYPEYPL